MTQTGIATPHDLLGGALPGRIHLITGAPGSGKTSACLHFLREGMRCRERAALLTLDRPADLRSHASHVGIDLKACLRDGRLTVLRYRPRFAQRVAELASMEPMLADLERMTAASDLQQMFGSDVPTRIAIDSISPFLGDIPTSGALAGLVDRLDESGITTLLTFNGEVTTTVDRRLEPLIERAAVILRFRHLVGTRFEIDIVRARHPVASAGPVAFEIRPGRGFVYSSTDVRRDVIPRVAHTDSTLLESLAPLVVDVFPPHGDTTPHS